MIRPTALKPLPHAVIFDLDDTLIVEGDTARQSFLAAAEQAPGLPGEALADAAIAAASELWRASPHLELGRALGIASWEAMWADFTGGHPCLDAMREWAPGFRIAAWTNALGSCGGDPSLAPALARAFVESQRAGHPEIPGAVDLLRNLHAAGRPVGILTNGPPDIQRLKLSQLGVDECLTTVVISGEAGIGKPDPRVFASAVQGLGVDAPDVVMIGDSWKRDIAGAAGAGIRSIWISAGRTPPGEVTDVSVVRTTADAGRLLGC